MKYEIGDLVSKPVTGICKIEDILYLNLLDEKNKKMYYLIKPIEDEKDKIYVPVSNSDSRLRLCLTKEEAWDLIRRKDWHKEKNVLLRIPNIFRQQKICYMWSLELHLENQSRKFVKRLLIILTKADRELKGI